MEYIIPTITGLCLSALLGFRAFLPPLALGVLYRMFPEMVTVNENFAFLAQNPVLIALGVAAVAEFLGDKIPLVDNFLCWLELPAKLVFSAILTYALIPGTAHWFYMLVALVFAESATMTVHAGKSGVRAASTIATGSIGNPLISFFEDVVSFLGTIAALLAPFIAVLILIYIIYRCVRFLFFSKYGNEGFIAKTKPSFAWYKFSQEASLWFFSIYNRMKIHGKEHLPIGSQFVVVANHASILDGFIIGGSINGPMFIMVKKEAFDNPIKGWYLRKVLCFPVDRSKPDIQAVKTAMRVLNDGYNLGIFPEGTRNRDGLIGEFKPGAIKFALRKKIAIVPAYIENSHLLTPPDTILPRPARMSVTFLKPLDTKAELAAGRSEDEILEKLYDLICDKGQEVTGRDVRVIK